MGDFGPENHRSVPPGLPLSPPPSRTEPEEEEEQGEGEGEGQAEQLQGYRLYDLCEHSSNCVDNPIPYTTVRKGPIALADLARIKT